ncbi:P-loop containing nucleoside triphosphate hydrolase protein [Kalaharituber pfeilii]|nr:P-loop containing nucleoside triphosphate hydrolase protein [Kalaharituber pfeilii]
MSKPIFVASIPRACSTAFERVFMTRPDILECHHEPFGDAYYYGPERLGTRFDGESNSSIREKSGFSHTTYKDVVERLLVGACEQRRPFIKDIAYYLIPPAGHPCGIAPSLQAWEEKTNSKPATRNGIITEEAVLNPTVLPISIFRHFQFTFLIRHPNLAIPSYYRCTIPPLSETTGFHYFDPMEVGFREARMLLKFLLDAQILKQEDVIVIDADDLLNNPRGIIEEYCKRVEIDFHESMLTWEERDCLEFEKWKGFHDDAIKSNGLKARTKFNHPKSAEENFQDWTTKFGENGARIIQSCVTDNMDHYEWLLSFRLTV